jgi:hypothetical protein
MSIITYTQKINKHSFIGVELEICIDQEFYFSLPRGIKNYYKYPENEDGTEYRPFGKDKLTDIILDRDPSCLCPPKTKSYNYYSAEINSPKMNRDQIPIFFEFLKNTLMKDMTKIYQGTTCGIHIHWSNTIKQKYKENPYYIFEFLKIMANLIKYMVYKITTKEFSGRIHKYREPEPIKIEFIDLLKHPDKNTFIEPVKCNFEFNKDSNFDSIYETFINQPINIYKFKPEFSIEVGDDDKTIKQKQKDRILKYISSLSLTTEKLNHLKDKLYFYFGDWMNFCDNILKTKLSDDSDDIDDLDLITYFLLTINFYTLRTLIRAINDEKDIKYFKDLENKIKILRIEKIYDPLITLSEVDEDEDELKGFLFNIEETTYKVFNQELENNELKMIFINRIYEEFRSMTDMHPYNLDDFHMEFRMFSLDNLFATPDVQVQAKDVVEELQKFILYTDTFMNNVLDKLNRSFDNVNNCIKPGDIEEIYLKDFLLDKDYKLGSKQVKKAMNNLFGIKTLSISTKPSLLREVPEVSIRLKRAVSRLNINSVKKIEGLKRDKTKKKRKKPKKRSRKNTKKRKPNKKI